MARTLIKTCKNKSPPLSGGGAFLGGVKGGGFRVLACADTGARTTLGVHQYFLLVLYLYCTYTFNTIIVRTSSYYYQISFKRLNMSLIGLTFISSVLIWRASFKLTSGTYRIVLPLFRAPRNSNLLTPQLAPWSPPPCLSSTLTPWVPLMSQEM